MYYTCINLLVRYEQLLREERILTQEITAFEKRIDTWLSNQLAARKDTHDPRHLPADNDREDSLPPAVIAFEVSKLLVND